MLEDWLGEQDRTDPPTYTRFDVCDITEIAEPTPEIEDYLRCEMASGRFDPAFLAAAAEEMGWDSVGRLFTTGQPITLQARRGYFGEVVSAAVVQNFRGYSIPVKKFRFAPHPDVSPPATDILAIKVAENGELAEVCLLEVKLRTNRERSIAIDALRQLVADRSAEFPNITRFVLERLHEMGHELFGPLARYLGSRLPQPALETSRIFLVFEKAAWSEDCLADLDAYEIELEPLTIHVALIADLGPLTDRLFAALGVRDIVDGD